MRDPDFDRAGARQFGRGTAWAVALVVGQIYGLIMVLTLWQKGELTTDLVLTAELFIIVIAFVAVGLFGWMASRPWLAHPLIYAFVGILTVVIGRLLAALILIGGAGVIALVKVSGDWHAFLAALAPTSLGFAIVSAVMTLLVPELLAIVCGITILNVLRGRFPGIKAHVI